MRKKFSTYIRNLLLVALAGGLIFLFSIWYDLPDIHSLPSRLHEPSVRITDRDGRLLYELIPTQSGRHAALKKENIPQCIKQAIVAVEDGNFYEHPGVDIEGIIRAYWINLQGGETLAGGSTITQQVARNLLLTQDERTERSLRRKLREAALAWQLAREIPKDDILSIYLNQTYFGGLAYGIEAASQTYFGKPASQLTLSECALLAGLPQGPGIYNPFTNPEKARERQRVVLGLMEKDGYITPAQRAAAEEAPLGYNPEPYPMQAPHFIWMIKAQLDQLYENGVLNKSQSLIIRTTLDLNVQRVAEYSATHQIGIYQQEDGTLSHNVNNAAVVVLNPQSGEILGLVGSVDYFNTSIRGAVNMATTTRQPGSAFKPFVYAQTLDPTRPHPWNAATSLMDVTTNFPTHSGAIYTPKNYDGQEHGPVTLRQALASSLNIPAVLALQEAGIPNTISMARKMDITHWQNPNDYDLSLALGGGQVSLLELANAYATFANQGVFVPHQDILDIHDADGNLIYQPERPASQRIFDPRVAWLINDILSDDQARKIGFGLNSTLRLDRPAAVKTGTTTNYHDNWTIGYTPDLLVGVWVGNSNYEAMRNVTGLTGAAPIWHNTIRTLLQNQPKHWFEQPEGLVEQRVCSFSGLLPGPACNQTHSEWFIAGTEPTETDNTHQQIWLDARNGQLAGPNTPADQRLPRLVYQFPPELQKWARAQGLLLLTDFTESGASASDTDIFHLKIIRPTTQTTYLLSNEIGLAAQQLQIEATFGTAYQKIIFWHNGLKLAECLPAQAACQAWWQISTGQHEFWLTGITAEGEIHQSEKVVITVSKE